MHFDASKLPGCSEYVRIPKASTRLANSAACITLASFDCWYAVILLYDPGVFWKWISSHFMLPFSCARLDTITILNCKFARRR